MRLETKTCQNCKNQFVIEPEDFNFYEKIKVPPPTWCPECRMIRKILWRNEWRLHKKKDSLTGKEIFSVFPPNAPVKIYEKDYWLSDDWDPVDYGMEYDWNRPFFEQMRDLLETVPLPSRAVLDIVNSDYSMNAGWLKNCYMVFSSDYVEDSAYVIAANQSKNCFDCHIIQKCELCYEGVNLVRCYKALFSVNCEDCQDILFSKDCIGCSSCFGCVNLRNKSFHIFNKPYSKEEYFERLKEFDLSSFRVVSEIGKKTAAFWNQFPNKFMLGRHNTNVSGDYVYNSKNALRCWRVYEAEDVKYCQNVLLGPEKDCYDHFGFGKNAELIYESISCGSGVYNLKFCWYSYSENKNLEYCSFCHNSSDLFACVGLRNKQYCILNKQYTKDEYEKLVPKIIQHMNEKPYVDARGRIYKYGEFFPPDLSPFAYNETITHEYFPITKDEALSNGYAWRDEEARSYTVTMPYDQLPDSIKDIQDSITGEIISCVHEGKCTEQCTTAFRVIPQELQFYQKFNLPLPRLCPNCRHYGRVRYQRSLKLYHRRCTCAGTQSENNVYQNAVSHFHGSDRCPNEFDTSYAPDRPEIVYCENCYNAEVV